jgi:Domain of unknown function (DUF397)
MGVQNSVTADELADLIWRTSSATNADNNNCVEAALFGEGVLVRDSKDRTRMIALSRGAWGSLLAAIEEGSGQ